MAIGIMGNTCKPQQNLKKEVIVQINVRKNIEYSIYSDVNSIAHVYELSDDNKGYVHCPLLSKHDTDGKLIAYHTNNGFTNGVICRHNNTLYVFHRVYYNLNNSIL
jgi:hypothetical protein